MNMPAGRYDVLEVHTTIHLMTDDGLMIEKYDPDLHDPTQGEIFYSGYVKWCKEGTLSGEWTWLFDAFNPRVARAAMNGIRANLFSHIPLVDNIEEVDV